jgi:hypothetical protein
MNREQLQLLKKIAEKAKKLEEACEDNAEALRETRNALESLKHL